MVIIYVAFSTTKRIHGLKLPLPPLKHTLLGLPGRAFAVQLPPTRQYMHKCTQTPNFPSVRETVEALEAGGGGEEKGSLSL